MRAIAVAGLFLLVPLARSQTAEPLSFEVATLKPMPARPSSAIYSFNGGPGTSDPGRFKMDGALKAFLVRALGIKPYQVPGPSWLDAEWFELVAKLPPTTTREQLDRMLLTMLVERFHLTYHHEFRELPVYELLVGKNGPSFPESDLSVKGTPLEPGARRAPRAIDEKGFFLLRPGPSPFVGNLADGIIHWASAQQPVSELARILENDLGRPVVDKTGLTGKYNIKIAYSRDGLRPMLGKPPEPADNTTPSGGPSLVKALQDQLGLKLESEKDPIDVIVIDHIERMPTEN